MGVKGSGRKLWSWLDTAFSIRDNAWSNVGCPDGTTFASGQGCLGCTDTSGLYFNAVDAPGVIHVQELCQPYERLDWACQRDKDGNPSDHVSCACLGGDVGCYVCREQSHYLRMPPSERRCDAHS